MKVKWLPKARRNLVLESDWLAARNPAAADDMLQTIRTATNQLAEQPGLGRPGRVPGTRELVIQRHPYLIPYRVRANTVEILRVFHTSRRPPEKW